MDGFFDWYRLFNQADFLAQDLVSFEGSIDLEGLGKESFLITKGNTVSVTFGDVMLSINMNNKNPFRFGERAIYLDANADVWLGIYRAN